MKLPPRSERRYDERGRLLHTPARVPAPTPPPPDVDPMEVENAERERDEWEGLA